MATADRRETTTALTAVLLRSDSCTAPTLCVLKQPVYTEVTSPFNVNVSAINPVDIKSKVVLCGEKSVKSTGWIGSLIVFVGRGGAKLRPELYMLQTL